MITLCYTVYRTGKRSTLGALKDGFNSAVRYYKNNFADGFRQVSEISLQIFPWHKVC